MEAHEQSDVAKADEVSAATSLQADSIPHDDPLADASCLHCGYSLCGLTENRCPECGTPFDPQEMAGSFLPEWPRLMVWYLTAVCVTAFLQLLSHGLWAVGSRGAGLPLFEMGGAIGYLFQPVVTLLIAPFAIIGLLRKTDWGRKAAIGLFVIQSLPLLPVSIYIISRLVSPSPYIGFVAPGIIEFIPAWNFAAQVSLPSILLACVLSTRLRRRSLRRSASNPPLALSRAAFLPSNDWPLVLVSLLTAGALTHFGSLGTKALWLVALSDHTAIVRGSWVRIVTSMACWTLLTALQCGWLMWIAREIWRRPASAQQRLKSFLIVAFVSNVAGHVINVVFTPERYSLSSPESVALCISGSAAYTLASLAIPLALYLYASRALPPEAVARVRKPQDKTATQIGRSLAEN